MAKPKNIAHGKYHRRHRRPRGPALADGRRPAGMGDQYSLIQHGERTDQV